MNDSIKQLSLDFHQSTSREEVKVKKGDNKRQIRISLVDGGKPYRISEGCYAAMTGTKPDGKKIFNECSIDGNTIVYNVTNQTSAVPGVVNCEVVLYDADDQRITSSKFTILVVDTEYTEGDDIESSDEVTFLTALIGDAVGAINNANTAAQNANDVAADLLQAKEDGEFKGEPGKDYVMTEADKKEIAEIAAEMVDVPEGGGNVDLTGYATEQFVRDGFQPKGNYLTAVPDGYAKTEDIPTKPEEVGADPKGAAASAVAQHNTATGSHNDIRLELKAINDRLTAFFDSDNQTLDELSEIVAYITSNKTLIDSITTSKVSVADIINNLTTNVSNKPLSAAQGVALKALIDAITVPTKLSQLANDAGFITSYVETDPTVPAWAKATTKPSYSKSEVGLGNVDNVKQYSASNPPPYPVNSVNGKTGAVTLDASAIGARPSNWIPTASEVGALPASTTIPSKTSQLTNDSGYQTANQVTAIVQQQLGVIENGAY